MQKQTRHAGETAKASDRAARAVAAYWGERFEREARAWRFYDLLTIAGVVAFAVYVVARMVIGGAA